MQPTEQSAVQSRRRRMMVGLLVPLFFGSAAFMNILGEPRFQEIRKLDVVRLISVGACWGVAFVGIVRLIGSRFRKS